MDLTPSAAAAIPSAFAKFTAALPTPSGFWTSAGFTSNGTGTAGVGTLRLAPMFLPVATSFDRIAAECTAAVASALFRPGIYASDANMQPAGLVVDGGTLDCSTTGTKVNTIALSLPAGIYWVGGASQGADATVRMGSVATVPRVPFTAGTTPPGFNDAGYARGSAATSGALPADSAGLWTMAGTIPFVWLRAV